MRTLRNEKEKTREKKLKKNFLLTYTYTSAHLFLWYEVGLMSDELINASWYKLNTSTVQKSS